MALVGVVFAKELNEQDYERASRGLISGDLGGGAFGAKGVPRGYPDPEGGHAGGRGHIQPTDKFFERKRGGADVPAHAMNRENTGGSHIPHPASHEALLEAEDDGPDSEADFHARSERLNANAMQGGRGLAGAMRRQGINSREYYPGTGNNVQGGIAPGVKYGAKTADIPGRVEAAPHEHKHAELTEEDKSDDTNDPGGWHAVNRVSDRLDALAQAQEDRERNRNTVQRNQPVSAGATTPNTEGRRTEEDAPEGTGSRRQED